MIGWHWASPPIVMKFAEIVRTEQTGDATIATIVQLAQDCGKNPVVINDTTEAWGFVANRLYAAMHREAAKVLEEGVATKEQIDVLMTDCFNWPVGPYGMVQGASSGWGRAAAVEGSAARERSAPRGRRAVGGERRARASSAPASPRPSPPTPPTSAWRTGPSPSTSPGAGGA